MKIPGLDELFKDLDARGDRLQATLEAIEVLLIKIEYNTRSTSERTK